ncbi:MAG: low specificity L-threonine aldolase [Chitinispirillaceae bacterium]|nr:low specificity L-threonine aldolase [Chitinispirillaceae bacterium]
MPELPKNPCFASDNCSGICPEAMDALIKANEGHTVSYGDDPWTREACDLFREAFETHCEVFFVFNGTAGNALALATLCRSYHSVICHEYAHIETDECGAPEFYSHGVKLLLGSGGQGKLAPGDITRLVTKRSDIHYPKPRAVSVTQATEFGTVYSASELHGIKKTAQAHGLRMHMDGARFANAVAELGVRPREIAPDCGIDVLVMGGSKNGLGLGDAVIFFDLALAEEFAYRCKQAGQLASKMRMIAAPWAGLLKNGVWLKNARHANACAERLAKRLREIAEVEILLPRQANSVFVKMEAAAAERLKRKGWHFYQFIGSGGARFMCSWNTTEAEVEALAGDLKESIRETKKP